jgi:hypothetical protein
MLFAPFKSIAALSLFVCMAVCTAARRDLQFDRETEKKKNVLMHSIYDKYVDVASESGVADVNVAVDVGFELKWKDNKFLLVEVTSASQEEGATAMLPELEALGFEATACSQYSCSGYLDITALSKAEDLPLVLAIHPSISITNQSCSSPSGPVISQAVSALDVDKVRAAYPSLTGKGMTIGVLSDSYNTLNGEAGDVASANLPDDVRVLQEYSQIGIDEGRAMIQLIFDLAPDAKFIFHTAVEGADDFANGIKELADAGCDIIVDSISKCYAGVDPFSISSFLRHLNVCIGILVVSTVFLIAYFTQPFFQEGVIAQAAADVAKDHGVPYFSSAGNNARKSWEGSYKPTACPSFVSPIASFVSCHDFGGGNVIQKLTVDSSTRLTFQWDQPFASVSGPNNGAITDLDLLFFLAGTPIFLGGATSDNISSGDPFEFVGIPPGTYDVIIANFAGPDPDLMKWITFGGSIRGVDPPADKSTSFGHKNTLHTAGVGAAYDQQTFGELELEFFSSAGGTPILFNRDGSRKDKPLVLKQPRFVGPDG